MNKIFVLIVLLTLTKVTTAQTKNAVVISVINENNEPLTETNVYIHTNNNKNKLYITDFAGKIKLDIELPFTLQINRIGYEPIQKSYSETQVKVILKDSKTELGGVVITGQTESKKVENAPQKITIIDSKKIQQLGAVSLKDVLINELNFKQSNDQILGATASIRGIGGQNIKILIDGVPLIGRENGNIDLSQINLSNIERIEIIEGPMAVNFGSDALAGVINLITKKNSFKKITGQLNTYYETIGRYNVDARIGFAVKNISYSIYGGRNFFGGWDTLPQARQQLWKPKTQYFIENQLSFKLGKSSFLRVQLNYYQELLSAKGNVNITPYEAYSLDQYYKTYRYNSILNFEKKFNNKHQLNIVSSVQLYKREKNTYYKDHVTLQQTLTPGVDEQDINLFTTYMSRGTYSAVHENKKTQWQIGYEYTHDIALGKKLTNEKQTITDIAAFGNIEYIPNNKWLLRLGTRSAWNSKFGLPIMPALNIKFTPNINSTYRFSYAKGYRSPSLKELNLYFVDQNHRIIGNENLTQETSDNFNLDFEKKHKLRKLSVTINGSLYFNHLYNMISLVATNLIINEYTYKNIDEFRNIGGTLLAQVKYKNISLKGGYGLMNVQSKFNLNDYKNNIHEFNGQLNIKWERTKIDFSLFYKFNGKQTNYILSDNAQSTSLYTIGSYHWMDASVFKAFYKNKLHITLGLKNILNIKNVNTTGNPGGFHNNSGNSAIMGYGRTGFINLKYYL